MLNSREWAIVTILASFAVLVLVRPDARRKVPQILRGFVSAPIFLPIMMLTVWVTLLVAGAARIGLWNPGLLKDTVVWFVASAFGTIFAALDAAKNDHYFRQAALRAVGAVAFFQYAMNLHTFNYPAELALQIVLILLTGLLTVTERNSKLTPVHRLLSVINVLIVLILLLLTTREVATNWSTFDTRQTLLGLALSIWIPLAVLPFIWVLALYLSHNAVWRQLRRPVLGEPAPLRTRVATVAALGPDVRTAHDLSNAHGELQTITRTLTWRETFEAVRMYRRRRQRRRAEPDIAARRVRRFAGVRGVDLNGRQLDQREIKETRDALHWLAACHAGHHHNRGRYRADLLDVLGDFSRHGLPHDHGIQMSVTRDGRSWFAWRRTPSGLILGIGAEADPTDRWFYADSQPPAGPPPHGHLWHHRLTTSPDWR